MGRFEFLAMVLVILASCLAVAAKESLDEDDPWDDPNSYPKAARPKRPATGADENKTFLQRYGVMLAYAFATIAMRGAEYYNPPYKQNCVFCRLICRDSELFVHKQR